VIENICLYNTLLRVLIPVSPRQNKNALETFKTSYATTPCILLALESAKASSTYGAIGKAHGRYASEETAVSDNRY
jgi:hypothetical protein